jgi:hypothetical protein
MATVTPPSIPRPKRKWLKTIAIVTIVLVTAFILLGVLISLLTDTGFTSPTEPVRTANIRVTVFNDDWMGSKSYSIYIDGNLMKTDTIGGMAIHEFPIEFNWRGGTLHSTEVMVFSDGGTYTKTITVEDGGTGEATFTI